MKLYKFPADAEKIGEIVGKSELASLLIPSPREAYVTEVCESAKKYGFGAVIATPYDCAAVMKQLEGSEVEVVCMNAMTHALDENQENRLIGLDICIKSGIRNFELSVPLGEIKDEKFDLITQNMTALVDKVHSACGKASLIIEPDCVNKAVQTRLVQVAEDAGADYVRIASGMEILCGMNGGRATVNNILHIADSRKGNIGIKAGGGWDYAYLEDGGAYLDAGACRIDAGPRFVEQLDNMGYGR